MKNQELNKQVLIDHYKSPCNYGKPKWKPDFIAAKENTLCGDAVKIFIKIENSFITKVSFTAEGCSICIAATSLLLQNIKGKSLDFVKQLDAEYVLRLVKVDLNPERKKCALLGFDALKEI